MTENEKALQLQVESLTKQCEMLRLQCEQSSQAYTLLMHQMKEMLRHRFGQKSERYIDLDDPQASLFDEHSSDPSSGMDEDVEDDGESDDNVTDIKHARRKKNTNKGFSDHLPRTEVIIPVEQHNKTCTCGCQKSVINHERHERLNYQPPVLGMAI